MPSSYSNNRRDPRYKAFRSGLTYQDVVQMFWSNSENPDDWQQISRGKVLRALGDLKAELFEQAHATCSDDSEEADLEAVLAEELAKHMALALDAKPCHNAGHGEANQAKSCKIRKQRGQGRSGEAIPGGTKGAGKNRSGGKVGNHRGKRAEAMSAPLNWSHPTTSAKLREKMAELTGDTAFLAFSCGKDAIAAWLAIKPHFKRIIPVHYVAVPGLTFIEKSLAYYEDFFECKILRRLHPGFVRILRANVFQSPEHWMAVEDADLPPESQYSHETIWADVRRTENAPNAFVANGVRACDSPYRRLSYQKHGAVNWNRMSWWPICDWNLQMVDEALSASGVKLPVDYRLWGRSFDGIDHRFLEPMRRLMPEDYKRVLEWFPLADLEMFRRTLKP
jgi:hypothetical protein